MADASLELHEGQQLPHVDVTTLDGRRVAYKELWQHRNLVLVVINPDMRQEARQYASMLSGRLDEFEDAKTTVVVTSDSVPELQVPCVVVTDRWGEIMHIDTIGSGDVRQWPAVEELLSWVRFAQIQCPECPP